MNINGKKLLFCISLVILGIPLFSQSSIGIKLPDTTAVYTSIIQNQPQKTLPSIRELPLSETPSVYIPNYQLGFFCKFEDAINRNNKFRIDFGTD